MAKKPRAQDPADAALSAIEEALSLGASDNQANRPRLPEADDRFVVSPDARSAAPRPATDRPAPTPRRAAANDDRASVGQMLQALQRRPSATPYIAALGAGLVWLLVGFILLRTL